MNVLYINYWGINEGLTQATTLPNLQILNDDARVTKVVFTTIEREDKKVNQFDRLQKVLHIPLYSGSSLLSKFADFTVFPKQLIKLCKKHNIHKIIARGAPTGGIAWLVCRKTKIPFIVESYEPHADYMLSGGTWAKNGIKYRIQTFLEKKQKIYAKGLIPVAYNYQETLIKEGISTDRLAVAPCPVDMQQFYFDVKKSEEIRNKLRCSFKTVVGIYVGKFGDIYYKEEVLPVFEEAFRLFADFRLVILTPQEDEFTERLKIKFGQKLLLCQVGHNEVKDYLSAADFAFATYKEGEVKKNLSPIKIGEYWACGLPVFVTEGIGDDSQIIKETGLGATFSFSKPESVGQGLKQIKGLLNESSVGEKIKELAYKHRSIERTKDAYEKLLFI